jgi:UDP-2,3-diacylglucosamine pyrophosphatase LpxH
MQATLFIRFALIAVLLCVGAHPSSVFAADPAQEPVCPPNSPDWLSPKGRAFVFISDLHMGLGKIGDQWNPLEDFRWPNALVKFLDRISSDNHDRVTLVIAGDMLELWQHPSVTCAYDQNHPCSVEQMDTISGMVVAAHQSDLQALGNFANRGENHLSIIPGNHDAALMLPNVWKPVSSALGAKDGKVDLVRSGVWATCEKKVLSEHGHQIGADLNNYVQWPIVTTDNGVKMYTPWGEWFVQTLFNKTERKYPLIDNIIPQSDGLAYYMGERGLIGSASDIAQVIVGNIFDTSLAQKNMVLGHTNQTHNTWNTSRARHLGYKLFADGLPSDSYLRIRLLDTNDSHFDQLRAALDQRAADPSLLSEERVRDLCDLLAMRKAETPTASLASCADPNLHYGMQALSFVGDDALIQARIANLMDSVPAPDVKIYVFGHTHQLDRGKVLHPQGKNVSFLNT